MSIRAYEAALSVLVSKYEKLEQENKELREKVEKMRNCWNCDNYASCSTAMIQPGCEKWEGK